MKLVTYGLFLVVLYAMNTYAMQPIPQPAIGHALDRIIYNHVNTAVNVELRELQALIKNGDDDLKKAHVHSLNTTHALKTFADNIGSGKASFDYARTIPTKELEAHIQGCEQLMAHLTQLGGVDPQMMKNLSTGITELKKALPPVPAAAGSGGNGGGGNDGGSWWHAGIMNKLLIASGICVVAYLAWRWYESQQTQSVVVDVNTPTPMGVGAGDAPGSSELEGE